MQTMPKTAPDRPLTDWQAAEIPVGYEEAVRAMEERVRAIREEGAKGLVWLLEHPPLYTAGTSAKSKDLINNNFPVYEAGRGGQYTYHGPGQRVGYVMMDLQKRGSDLRRYICDLEEWMILALKDFDVKGERRQGRVGIWVATGNSEAKIAAIGVRVRKWVSYHGVAVNLNPDLSHYNGIVPCGISEYGVTSLAKLGVAAGMADLDTALQRSWQRVFA
ncbi:MAG: lipoyl(octanoyl) transferase LipB [Alphaproteobacteria bacterium]|nr:lipoyl(octanoyl) transferase LipB [Alphaproteobacteria bacterium]